VPAVVIDSTMQSIAVTACNVMSVEAPRLDADVIIVEATSTASATYSNIALVELEMRNSVFE
jgi:hypothetical protein